MKKIILLLGFFVIFFNGFSQPKSGKDENFEKYQSMKVSYMTDKLNLTPEEAQIFWPVYNEFDKKRFEIHKKSHDVGKKIHDNIDKYTEKDYRNFITEMENQELAEVNLAKEYNEKFLKILSAKKVFMIGNVEKDFRFKMLREFRGKENNKTK
ncbi:MAG: hypothetical protein JJE45_06060 [Prolixibacteraceae bacterium]|nr:hypothetical protein [Prolixibacteraceae bacterium]